MKIKAYRTTATTLKKLAHRRVQKPKIDIYDDSTLDMLDDMASKWAMRVDRLRQQKANKRLGV